MCSTLDGCGKIYETMAGILLTKGIDSVTLGEYRPADVSTPGPPSPGRIQSHWPAVTQRWPVSWSAEPRYE